MHVLSHVECVVENLLVTGTVSCVAAKPKDRPNNYGDFGLRRLAQEPFLSSARRPSHGRT
jgi:hypothetical protein